jgi:hypothetical protein
MRLSGAGQCCEAIHPPKTEANVFKKINIVFSAGCFGALVNSIALWAVGAYGVTAAIDVNIAPRLSPSWLYPRIVWGGIWGLLFLLPLLRNRLLSRGLILSLGPTLIQLIVVFPNAGKGMMGLKLGLLTPLVVVALNAVWGISTALWLRWTA